MNACPPPCLALGPSPASDLPTPWIDGSLGACPLGSRMPTVSTLSTLGLIVVAGGFLAWLGLPAQPPVDTSWPDATPAARAAMATELARGVSQAWQANQKQLAWEQAQIVLTAYPEQPYSPRLEASRQRLEDAARQERWAQKWAYQTLEGAGWGRLSQAQLEAEPLSFNPDLPGSSLVVRTGSLSQYQAIFLIPGVPLPAECQTTAGCVLPIQHGTSQTPLRLVPSEDGWYRFTDPQRVLEWLKQRQGLAVAVSQEEPLRFETQGLDLPRMGLN